MREMLDALKKYRLQAAAVLCMMFGAGSGHADTVASLLGNFTINQFCAVTVNRATVDVHYVVVYGQLPALRELHAADADRNGVTTAAERDHYVGTLTGGFADGMTLMMAGARVPLRAIRWSTSLPSEQGGFSLRVDVDLTAALPEPVSSRATALTFANQNFAGRLGWHEIVVQPAAGVAVFDTDAVSSSATAGLTEALQALPDGGPLDERTVHMTVDDGTAPSRGRLIGPRPQAALPLVKQPKRTSAEDGLAATESEWITRKSRELINVISAPQLAPRIALWALFAALVLGAVHALSPGHGKTIVGAYLIGSRGTPRHALFLGFTVT
ncbi:MAG: hypothetical protein M3O06_02385, partial [Pseudomonadota bacterium]|nr:hypothetical protein [Pseudomonadota bacterium]